MPAAGRPLVGYVIERARRIANLTELVFATSDRSVDDELAEYVETCGVSLFRGDAADVAGRALAAADLYGAEYVLRLNGDSPFPDPVLIGRGIELLADQPDMVTNLVGRTFPYGVSVEIIARSALAHAHPQMSVEEREHVTAYFYRNDSLYRVASMTSDSPEIAAARMVVDTAEDMGSFRKVVHALGDSALTADYRKVANCYLATSSVQG